MILDPYSPAFFAPDEDIFPQHHIGNILEPNGNDFKGQFKLPADLFNQDTLRKCFYNLTGPTPFPDQMEN